ncbi:MAG: V-type ATP synthase subunit F [Parcubacteria group bacterium]
MKIAILGNQETILGFKALGVDTLGVREEKEAERIIEEVYIKKEYAVLIITEDWFLKLKDKIKLLSRESLPALVCIPVAGSSEGLAQKELKKIVEKAIGSDIFSRR